MLALAPFAMLGIVPVIIPPDYSGD